MRHLSILAVGTSVVLASTAIAQHTGLGQHHPPYADISARAIKSLSDEQIGDLESGRGMGLSLPAELNGYPGPKHVLELADSIGLSAAQRETTIRRVAAMTTEAVSVGQDIIALEARLETLFVERKASPDTTRAVVEQIGTAQAKLRFVHLKHHLAMQAEMTPEQIRQYAALRGDAGGKQ